MSVYGQRVLWRQCATQSVSGAAAAAGRCLGCVRRRCMAGVPWRAVGRSRLFLVKDVGKDTEKRTSPSTLQPCNKYKSGRRRQHGAKSERRREGRVTNHVLANPCTRAGSLSCSRSFRTVDTTVWCVFFFTCERTPPNRGRGARPHAGGRAGDQETQSPLRSPWFS